MPLLTGIFGADMEKSKSTGILHIIVIILIQQILPERENWIWKVPIIHFYCNT